MFTESATITTKIQYKIEFFLKGLPQISEINIIKVHYNRII